jgi:hypothetical protein
MWNYYSSYYLINPLLTKRAALQKQDTLQYNQDDYVQRQIIQ